MLIKEYKKAIYHSMINFSNDDEIDYILEHLVYYSFDKNEKVFGEEIVIEGSYEVNQLFGCYKFYLNSEQKLNNLNEIKEKNIVDNLFKEGKVYHIYQHNSNGKMLDGALLIPEKGKKYNLILYQVTKKKVSNRVSNENFSIYKEMVKNNLEIMFNIQIEKCTFIYILLFEDKDTNLIKFCNKLENKLDYIFYSIERNEFLNEKVKKIKIKNYIKDLKNMKNYLICFPKNDDRDEKELNYLISNIPTHLDLISNKSFLSHKVKRDINNEENKIEIFIEFYDKNNSLICNNKNKNKKQLRIKFFNKYNDILPRRNKKSKNNQKSNIKNQDEEDIYDKYDLKYEEENDDNKDNDCKASQSKIIDLEEYENIKTEEDKNEEKDKRKIEGKKLIKNYLNEEIIYSNEDIYYGYEFSQKYNDNIKIILNKIGISNEETEKARSYLFCASIINILSNILIFPIYYLIVKKQSKEIYIILQYKEEENIRIFDYNKLEEINNENFAIIINALIKEKEKKKNYIIIFCSIEEKRSRD